MGEAGSLIFSRKIGEIFHPVEGRGVFGVNPEHIGNQLVIMIESKILPLDVFRIGIKIVETGADNRPKACIHVCLCVGLVVHIHVRLLMVVGGPSSGNSLRHTVLQIFEL